MTKITTPLARLVASLAVALLAAAYFAGPATAAPVTHARASAFAVAKTHKPPHSPCGIKHYPRCPPPPHIGHQHHPVRRGHHYHITCSHFPPHRKVFVRIKGHHHNRLLRVVEINRHGNRSFHVTIPKHFRPGIYRVVVRVSGSHSKVIKVRVTAPKHRHHH